MMPGSHLKVLVQLAKSDGEFDQSEREFIHKFGQVNGLREEEIHELIENTEPDDTFPDLSNLDFDEKFEYMYSIVQLMRADGKLHRNEISFCLRVTRELGYGEQALFEFITATYSDPRETYNKDLIKKKMFDYFNKTDNG